MAEVLQHVIDASVVVRWYLNNPPFVEPARRIRADYQVNALTLTAPDNLRVEVGGAIHQAVLARHLQAAQGETYYSDFLDWNLPLVETFDLLRPAFRLSIRFGCSFYDAIYLALAESIEAPFLHADRRLHHALDGRFPRELWIEDYIGS